MRKTFGVWLLALGGLFGLAPTAQAGHIRRMLMHHDPADVVDLVGCAEFLNESRVQITEAGPETKVARLRGQTAERLGQRLTILRRERAHYDRGAIAQLPVELMSGVESHAWLVCPTSELLANGNARSGTHYVVWKTLAFIQAASMLRRAVSMASMCAAG